MIKSRVFLIGMRGSGKSSVGVSLASLLGYSFVDTDVAFTQRQGKSIEDFVKAEGWESFRRVERATLLEVTEANTVVGTGGGIILDEANVLFMREAGVVVFLDVPVTVLAQRLARNSDTPSRPSLTGQSMIDELGTIYDQRIALYKQAAHLEVNGEQKPSQVARTIMGALENSIQK